MRWLARGIKGISVVLIACLSVLFTTQTAYAGDLPFGVAAVDQAASGGNDGTSWTDAYTDLQDALEEAGEIGSNITSIWVAQGTYVPSVPQPGGDPKPAFILINGVGIYGGFLGTSGPNGGETLLSQRDPENNITIISGDILGDDNDPGGGTEDNVWRFVRVFEVDNTTILNGFTISGGHVDSCESGDGSDGGALIIIGGSPKIVRCTFEGNNATSGGAVLVTDTSNSAEPVFINCVFKDNISCLSTGGAVHIGKALAGVVTFHNCLFSGNAATSGNGGGLFAERSEEILLTLNMVNCTFEGNDAFGVGGGINVFQSDTTLVNCIFWGNTDGDSTTVEEEQIFFDSASTFTVTNTCIEGLISSGQYDKDDNINNIDDDPLFVDATNSDYRLMETSPCIDTADNNAIPMDVGDLNDDGNTTQEMPFDLDLLQRNQDSSADCDATIDMGAYEFQPCPWDLDDNCVVDIIDLTILLSLWGTDPGGPPDFDCDSDVSTADLLTFFANWGPCPCGGSAPLSIEQEMEDACLTMDHWDEYVEVMQGQANQATKDRYQCWMEHYINDCNKCICIGASGCPNPDPFD